MHKLLTIERLHVIDVQSYEDFCFTLSITFGTYSVDWVFFYVK